jgi:hypothetical protein
MGARAVDAAARAPRNGSRSLSLVVVVADAVDDDAPGFSPPAPLPPRAARADRKHATAAPGVGRSAADVGRAAIRVTLL